MAETAAVREPRKAAPRSGKKAAPLRATPTEAKYIGRFAELITEVDDDEPYQITETVAIQPPSKARMQEIIEAQTAYVVARGQVEAMMSPLVDEAGEVVRDENQQPILPQLNRETLQQVEALVQKAAESYDRALFGDAYGDIMRMSQSWTGKRWNAFYEDVQNTFLPVPQDGRCPQCGNIVDEEAAGKAPASSTSSSTTGTQ